jgi:hypothetical protein
LDLSHGLLRGGRFRLYLLVWSQFSVFLVIGELLILLGIDGGHDLLQVGVGVFELPIIRVRGVFLDNSNGYLPLTGTLLENSEVDGQVQVHPVVAIGHHVQFPVVPTRRQVFGVHVFYYFAVAVEGHLLEVDQTLLKRDDYVPGLLFQVRVPRSDREVEVVRVFYC